MVFKRNPKSIAVTVIADGKSKVYGDENALTAGYWCCQWRYHQLYPATTATQFSNVGHYPIAVTLEIT
jgi:hypothetical protein